MTWLHWLIIGGALLLLGRGGSSIPGGGQAYGGGYPMAPAASSDGGYPYAHLVGKGGNCSNLGAYRSHYVAAGQRYNIDWKWLAAQGCVESGYNPHAISSAGACGIAQIMPATARGEGLQVAQGTQYRGREFPVTLDAGRDQRFDPALAINVQAKLISRWRAKFGGDLAMAFGCYRSGPGNIAARGLSDGDRLYVTRISARYANL